ncbi:MAG TPA: class I SAM-dependent methyltransferase [Candidatus Dormibacteraeota bacterium]|nr:class I SAM-dependent methyltransferase [Candidatus Dormibacteraeota bacterium]
MADPPVGACFSVGSIAETYEDIYVPRIFGPWARLLADSAQLRPGEAVLDIATGPGSVARVAAERVGPTGRVVGADISEAMIGIARQKPELAGAAPIEYLIGPAAPLPVVDASFDVVLCQQGLQFFPDAVAAVHEMRRALKPGGRVAAAVWQEIAMQPSFAAIDAALRECLSPDVARTYGAPFGVINADGLTALLAEAGFKDIRVEVRRLPLTLEGGVPQFLAALGASPIATTIAELDEPTRARFLTAAMRRLEPLVKDGEVRSEMVSNIVTGRRAD